MKDNQKNNSLERFVIAAFAFILVAILVTAGILIAFGIQQLNIAVPLLANFGGETTIVDPVTPTAEVAGNLAR